MLSPPEESFPPTEESAHPSFDEYDDHEGEEEEHFTLEWAIQALAIVSVLIALTILFEKFKHHTEHNAGRAMRPIVNALFGELTVLGFLSALTFSIQKAHGFDALSRLLLSLEHDEEGDAGHRAEELHELLEDIHFGMFFIMVFFMVQVLAEVRYGLESRKEWCSWDRACNDDGYVEELIALKADMDAAYDTSKGGLKGVALRLWRGHLSPYLRFLPRLRVKKETLEDKMQFCGLRMEFKRNRSIDPPFLPFANSFRRAAVVIDDEYFNFGRYLSEAYSKKMAHIVHISVSTWICFFIVAVCCFALFCILGYSMKAMAWAWVIAGWMFYILSVKFEQYLLGIRNMFLAPEFIPRQDLKNISSYNLNAMNEDNVGTEKEPMRKFASTNPLDSSKHLPMWCHIDLDERARKRSWLVKKLFGPSPKNRQHAVFPLHGEDGPRFHTAFYRFIVVMSCVYSSQLLIVLVPALARDESTSYPELFAYIVLGAIPGLAFMFNNKRLVSTLIQVGSVGAFVLPQAITESERAEKTAVIVRLLVIFFRLACTAQDFLKTHARTVRDLPANPSLREIHAHGDYADVFTGEEIAALKKIFNEFLDQDGAGVISGKNFQQILSPFGITITGEEADGLVKSIVKAIDSNSDEVGISLDIFLQWYVRQLGCHNNKVECAKFLFNLLDEDKSGYVTVLEFKQRLDELAVRSFSSEEVNDMIMELDQDGDGVLGGQEFQEMIEHFWPIELVVKR